MRLIFKQALVDIPQMSYVKVTVGDTFALLGTRQEFDNLRQSIVAKFVLFKKRVMLRIEKPSVVLRDKVVPTAIDERK